MITDEERLLIKHLSSTASRRGWKATDRDRIAMLTELVLWRRLIASLGSKI